MNDEKNMMEKIRQMRESKNISLEELAERSGLALDKLKCIEKTTRLPSLWTSSKIAAALDMKLEDFLKEIEGGGPVISRKNDRGVGENNTNYSNRPKKHMHYYALSESKGGRHMEPFIIDVDRSADVDFVLSTHEGEEFIYVLDGSVDITYGNNLYHLEEGDCIYYDSVVEHQMRAGNNRKAKILAVVYLPV
ncbi:MAG: XRE family transcriptional regulator [Candidatus Azobacteroides sp.]|nr:XRE family transcriptional regulator [Candidatus Azobacteroides sp.]